MGVMVQAVLLTGGRSRRMGRDKATLPVEGEPLAARIVRLLAEAGVSTVALGRESVEGAGFFADDETVRSPLDALRRFEPSAPFAFVLSCDLPRFDPRLIGFLRDRIGDADAAAPFVDGFRQPMVALYRRQAFGRIPDEGCPNDWLRALAKVRLVDEAELGPLANATRGANTPEELEALLGSPSPSGSSWRGGRGERLP